MRLTISILLFFVSPFLNLCAADFDALSDFAKAEIIKDYIAQLDCDIASATKEHFQRAKRIAKRLGLESAYSLKFAELEKKIPTADEGVYIQVRKLKRELLFADASIDFDEILCVDAPYPIGSEGAHEGRIKTENTACFGARLIKIETKNFKESAVLYPKKSDEAAAIGRADLFFDASKIVFSMRKKSDTNYHLYKIGSDGAAFEKLTNAQYNDSDPAWLPDGNIVFCTSRCNQYLRCGGSEFRLQVLARCDSKGKNIYFISTNNESDSMPYVLDDGRILYCRWEYVDKNIFRLQSLWTINPDGTNSQVFWGNQSHYPDVPLSAMQIPQTDKYLFQSSSHHNVYRGGLGVIVPSEGLNYPDGIYNLSPQIGWAEAGFGSDDKPFDKNFQMPKTFSSFYCPYPISKNLYLVSARTSAQKPVNPAPYTSGFGLEGSAATRPSNTPADYMSLYLADFEGNMELIFKGEKNIHFAQPFKARKVPRSMPDVTVWQGEKTKDNCVPLKGVLYSSNIYENSGIPLGAAKYLRVVEHCALTYDDGLKNSTKEWFAVMKKLGVDPDLPFITSRPELSKYFLSGETTMSILLDESHKRILGEVPIEADGSVHFEVPPMRAVYFQVLDKDRKVLQTMRSSTHVTSGESRGCLGCHSTQIAIAPPMKPSMALRKKPSKLKNNFGDITFGFARYIQPILDKHCVDCHNREKKNPLVYENEKLLPDWNFSVSYLNLVLGINLGKKQADSLKTSLTSSIFPYHAYENKDTKLQSSENVIPPMTVLSYASKLLKVLEAGHNDVKLSQEEIDTLKAWIDLNTPFYGEEDILEMPDIAPADFYSNKKLHEGLSYAPKMRTVPDVDRAYKQDKFDSQSSRIPKDADGNPRPSIRYEDGVRKVEF